MISTTTTLTRVSAQVLEPLGANKKLDLQHGEVQRQVWLPQSFVLKDTIPNPMGSSTLMDCQGKGLIIFLG
jgi:hypothetical protein